MLERRSVRLGLCLFTKLCRRSSDELLKPKGRRRLTDQHRVDLIKRHVDLLPDLGASQDDLARDEDEEHDLGLHHAVDETGKELQRVSAGSTRSVAQATIDSVGVGG